MRRRFSCWRSYVWVTLTRLGFCYANDIRHIIALVIRVLREQDFVFRDAEDKLNRRKFRNSPEQRQTMAALRKVLHLEPGEEEPRRRRRTESLSDRNPSAEEIDADPALQLHRKELAKEAMAALDLLPARDRQILHKIVVERVTYRVLAEELRVSVGYLHNRVQELTVTLAMLIAHSRTKNRRV